MSLILDERGDSRAAYSIDGFCKATGLGRTFTYELIARGELEARKAGHRTLIPADAVTRWLSGLPKVRGTA